MNHRVMGNVFLCHTIILLITVFLSVHVIEIFGYEVMPLLIHSILISCLYILGGYLLTDRKVHASIVSYFSISLTGLIIWGISFLSSPNDLDWKHGKGGMWLIYQLYIASYGISLGNLFHFENTSHSMIFLMALSIIPTIFILIGKQIKEKTLPNIAHKPQRQNE